MELSSAENSELHNESRSRSPHRHAVFFFHEGVGYQGADLKVRGIPAGRSSSRSQWLAPALTALLTPPPPRGAGATAEAAIPRGGARAAAAVGNTRS